MIFSGKAMIYTLIGAGIGYIFHSILKSIGIGTIGLIILILFAGIGFVIGTCKMPPIESIKLCRQTAGENIDDIIKRGIKFKLKKNKIYVYAKEEKDNVIK